MKYFSTLKILLLRMFKLFFYYVFCSPFFITRFFLVQRNKHDISLIDKTLLIFIGEVWLFGKNILDLREIYELQRLEFKSDHSVKKLLKYLPGQWLSLSPLESALTILMSSKDTASFKYFFYTPYVIYLILFDESRHSIKANHGIACALALSIIFKKFKKISDSYYLKALKILKSNSNLFFYDEGSTGYHIFVTSLFKHYFNLLDKKPSWFNGYEDISIQLLNHKNYFYFGDDDRSNWLFTYRERTERLNKKDDLSIIDLIENKRFAKSVLNRYFKIYTKDERILILCVQGSKWGHAHIMLGSFMYFVSKKPLLIYKKNNEYTLDKSNRRKDRLFTCNSPINTNSLNRIKLEFFKNIPRKYLKPTSFQKVKDQISISSDGWKREINFSNPLLEVYDSSKNNIEVKSSLDDIENDIVIKYSNLSSI